MGLSHLGGVFFPLLRSCFSSFLKSVEGKEDPPSPPPPLFGKEFSSPFSLLFCPRASLEKTRSDFVQERSPGGCRPAGEITRCLHYQGKQVRPSLDGFLQVSTMLPRDLAKKVGALRFRLIKKISVYTLYALAEQNMSFHTYTTPTSNRTFQDPTASPRSKKGGREGGTENGKMGEAVLPFSPLLPSSGSARRKGGRGGGHFL